MPTSCCARATRSRRRTTSRRRWSRTTASGRTRSRARTPTTYYAHVDAAIDHEPQITMDDGADVVGRIHAERTEALADIIGGTEETTTGVIRLRAMAADGALKLPDRLGQRREHQAPLRQPLRHRPVHARRRHPRDEPADRRSHDRRLRLRLVRARHRDARRAATGANVIVCEVDPLRALEAVMDGYRVMPAVEAAALADIWITVTGDINVIGPDAFDAMKDGAIIANSGHFNVEIDIPHLRGRAVSRARGPPARRGVHARRTAASSTCSPTAVSSTSPRRGPPGVRHGHVLRQPGALGRVHGRRTPPSSSPASTRSGRHRRRHRSSQARDDGRDDRHAHRASRRSTSRVAGGHGLPCARAPCAGSHDIPRTLWWRSTSRPAGRRSTSRPVAPPARRRRARVQRRTRASAARSRAMAVRGAPALGVAAALGARAVGGERDRGHRDHRRLPRRTRRRGRRDHGHAPDGRQPVLGRRAHAPLRHGQRRPRAGRAQGPRRRTRRSPCRRRTRQRNRRDRRVRRGAAARRRQRAHALQRRARSRPRTSVRRSASIFTAHEQGKIAHVWVDETRPVLQGGRLTAWELRMAGVPFRADRRQHGGLRHEARAGSMRSSSAPTASPPTATPPTRSAPTAWPCSPRNTASRSTSPPRRRPSTSRSRAASDIVIEERDPRELLGFTVLGRVEPRHAGRDGRARPAHPGRCVGHAARQGARAGDQRAGAAASGSTRGPASRLRASRCTTPPSTSRRRPIHRVHHRARRRDARLRGLARAGLRRPRRASQRDAIAGRRHVVRCADGGRRSDAWCSWPSASRSARFGAVQRDGSRALNAVIIYVALPALIFRRRRAGVAVGRI